ncbi:hypothetical protein Tco_1211860 [Tanacetum coccineum]
MTRSKATPNEVGSLGTTSGGGPTRQETIGDTIAQTRYENVSKLSNDPLLARGNTLRSGITLVSTHFDADTNMFRAHDLDGDEVVVESEARAAITPTIITVITDDKITLAKALAELKSAKPPTQAASTRPKVKGIVFQEPGTTTTPTISSQQPSQENVQDKVKGKVVKPKKTMKKK